MKQLQTKARKVSVKIPKEEGQRRRSPMKIDAILSKTNFYLLLCFMIVFCRPVRHQKLRRCRKIR